MTGRILPRYLALTATLTLVVGGLMLTVFYGQYLLLSDELVETGTRRFDDQQVEAFEDRSATELIRIADLVASRSGDANDRDLLQRLFDSLMAENDDLTGLAYVPADGDPVAVGDVTQFPVDIAPSTRTQTDTHSIVLEQNIVSGGRTTGLLYGQFSLEAVEKATADFRDTLLAADAGRRAESFGRVLAVVGFGALFCGVIIWMVVQSQNRRIADLKAQAVKLSQANFGEPLDTEHRDEIGELTRAFNSMREVLQQTTVSRDLVDKILSGMSEAIFVTDAEGSITRVNDAAMRMLQFDEDELLGRDITSLLTSSRHETLQVDTQSSIPDEGTLIGKHGDAIPVSYTGSEIEPGNGLPGVQIFAAQNITERRKAEKRIRYLARIDPLTKVPNRMQFQHLLQQAIARANRRGHCLSLIYIDVDHFKEINDTFGHMAGDTALETVANRLAEALPEDCIIGRLAGDEFAVIVDKLQRSPDTMRSLESLARRTLDRLAEPLYVQGHEVFIAASMGIACYPDDGTNVIDLIRNADAALYHSKKGGGNTFTHYNPNITQSNVERLMTKSKLKRAFERDELLVRYQPRYEIETGRVVGAEALVRWQLPDQGLILPSDFIPLAEENDLIVQIGEWVLDRVCEDFRYWQRSVSSPGRVSVNLSLRQLRHPNFINRIVGIMRSYEVSPTSLELEITETTLMENPVRTIGVLEQLYAQGLHLAIDDFGTGYSSLSALQQFPINTLKIDRSFVREVATNVDDATIVGTIIQMGNSLDKDVVAEGVETEEQLNFLQQLGCAYVQGLLFGEPMSSEDYLDLVLAQAEGTDKYRALFA